MSLKEVQSCLQEGLQKRAQNLPVTRQP